MRNKIKRWILIPVIGVLGVLFLFEKSAFSGKNGVSETDEEMFCSGIGEEEWGDPSISFESADRVTENTEEKTIFVCVSGCVLLPGVYELKSGSRVFEAIHLAGGFTEDAVTDSLNQARILRDEEIIFVPGPDNGFTDNGSSYTETNQKININTAGLSEIMSLPGIGEQKARQVIAYREANGAFRDVQDIMKVSGIGESIFSKIRDLIEI